MDPRALRDGLHSSGLLGRVPGQGLGKVGRCGAASRWRAA